MKVVFLIVAIFLGFFAVATNDKNERMWLTIAYVTTILGIVALCAMEMAVSL